MIAHVIRWSARNVFLVGLATALVIFAGIYAVSRVPLDPIPDLSDVVVCKRSASRSGKFAKFCAPATWRWAGAPLS
jgi:Cu/Ag efflux pump CusA